MGQELKIRHCVLKIKVNTNLIVRTGPNKAYIILQLKFYHHSGSSNSESQFQVLTLQVQVQVQVLTVQVQVQVLGLRVPVKSKSSRNRTRVRLESKSRTRVLQLCVSQLLCQRTYVFAFVRLSVHVIGQWLWSNFDEIFLGIGYMQVTSDKILVEMRM